MGYKMYIIPIYFIGYIISMWRLWRIVVVCKYDYFYSVGEGGGCGGDVVANSANIMRIDSMLVILL